jgi:competence protein ComEA
MPSHRREPETEPVSLRRLTRALGAAATGWTPPQAQPLDIAPATGGGMLLAPQRPALAWLIVAGLAVLVLSGFLLSQHHDSAPGATQPAPAVATPIAVGTATAAGIVVDVGGRVRHPGLVTLPAGARVADAIAAAGGALRPADLERIDLAAHVTDGQLLLIGIPGAVGSDLSGATGAGGAVGPVDLNTATVEQLDALPGVGPVLAQRIISWRQAHGGFRTVDDLQQVPGIGARKFSDLKALVSA